MPSCGLMQIVVKSAPRPNPKMWFIVDGVLFEQELCAPRRARYGRRDMQIHILKSKIHRVTITQAELHYIGSITIDEDLMDAANLVEYEKVQVVNVNNGERFETYVIKGERNSGVICLNGPAARKGVVGDVVIVISYALLDQQEARTFQPIVVFPKDGNRL